MKFKVCALALFCFAINIDGFAQSSHLVSNPKNLSGKEYINPVIDADYSDPDVVAAPDGKTFYMTASSFQCAPGLPILKSTDLVNWQLVNHALKGVPPIEHYSDVSRHGDGVWAPCIRYHNGEYFIYWGDPDYGIFMVKTDNPEEDWEEPVLVKEGKGMIDTTPFWDEDGKAYLANGWANSRCGFNSVITISEMSPDGTKLISEPWLAFDGHETGDSTIEGPKLYKKDGYYYILAPAGGVETGWQLALRSKNIYGPYDSKIVMAQGVTDINGPHQGGWISTSDGEDWFLHFQEKGASGRVIHLNPVTWKDGWPVIGKDDDGNGCGDPVRKFRKPTVSKDIKVVNASDIEKDSRILYQWHGNYNNHFGFPINNGLMKIYGHKVSDNFVSLWEVPNLWLKKFPSENFEFITEVKICAKSKSEGVSSGIVVMGRDYARLGLLKTGNDFVLQFITCKDADKGAGEEVKDIIVIPGKKYDGGADDNLEKKIWFRVRNSDNGVCIFSYSLDGQKFEDCGKFMAREGKWIGAKIGYYSITPHGVGGRGWIDIIDANTKAYL